MTTGTPFFFGAPGKARQFGWYYAPDDPAVREATVLLCQPLAQEYLYSYRAFRILAERLAALGFPVLRFEYPGLGNAEGDGERPDQLTLWEDGIVAALAELRARSGVEDVVVIGLRLGATLAMHTLSHRVQDVQSSGQHGPGSAVDVRGMVLWDPVVTGKSYVRQTHMLARTVTGVQRTASQDGELDALGYTISSETVRALSAIDLAKETTLPPPRGSGPLPCLVIEREGSAAQEKLVAHLEALGATVSTHEHPEIDRFLVNAELSVLPGEVLDTIVDWVDTVAPGRITASGGEMPFESRLSNIDGAAVTEEIAWFGQRIFGIVTRPDMRASETQGTGEPVVLFLNMGTDHHIGPRRMNVLLARALAAEGITSVRIDLPGIGDSPARPGVDENLSYPSSAIADIREVIRDLRERYHVARVMLGGMCAGGWHSVFVAQADPAVAGIFPINPPLYFRDGSSGAGDAFIAMEALQQNGGLQGALASGEKWRRLLRGEMDLGHIARVLGERVTGAASALRRRVLPDSSAGPTEGGRLVELFPASVPALLIFDETHLSYRYFKHHTAPVLDRLLGRNGFIMQVVPGGENVFMSADGQRKLNHMILAWVREHIDRVRR